MRLWLFGVLAVTITPALHAQAQTQAENDDPVTEARRYCVVGHRDLGHRLQGLEPRAGELVATSWCVTSADGEAVRFDFIGRINSDVEEQFTSLYEPENGAVTVGPPAAPQVRFVNADIAAEARRVLRLDPHWLARELPEGDGVHLLDREQYEPETRVQVENGRISQADLMVRLPLRGIVQASYRWWWEEGESEPGRFAITLGGVTLFEGDIVVTRIESAPERWAEVDEIPEAPGEYWPTRIGMRLEELQPGVHVMRSSRTGFDHLVVETQTGLVVADAPAGWTDFSQLPPVDMLPEDGISGLSEHFVDALSQAFPDTPIRAVVLTHHHDDHAGGARAFAAAGARVYAPLGSSDFLAQALNHGAMPPDRLGERRAAVTGIAGNARLEDPVAPVELLAMNGNPHAHDMLGLWLPRQRLFFQSDIHYPSDSGEFPPEARAEVECWFANWAIGNLPEDAQILSSHTPRVTVRRELDAVLRSSRCHQGSG